MAAAVTRPSNLGQSMYLTSSLSSSTKPHSAPARKRRLLKWASRPSTAAPGVAVASIFACRVPFFVKTLILPSSSPATKYFDPDCDATARAVTLAASPSLPGGTCICLCSVALTLTDGPRNCESFSSVEFLRACLWSLVKRICRTATLCTRMTPPASPVARKYSSCEGDTVRWVTGCSWPAEKLSTSSPEGEKSRTVLSTCAATSNVEGMAVCVELDELLEPDRGFRSGKNLMKLTGSSCGITALDTR
mmetsp:Transcript_92572/g.207268  ORF Transcript_92572/g.207268 Transcript_92572/m.207268 type:complete len:248 (+) Transcript_92572:634-1377(+)